MTSREMADCQLRLRFNEQAKHWDFVGYGSNEPPMRDTLLEAVQDLVAEHHEWQGTASELLELLHDYLDPDTKPNILARRLNASASRLEQDYGIDYRTVRKPDARIIHISLSFRKKQNPEIDNGIQWFRSGLCKPTDF